MNKIGKTKTEIIYDNQIFYIIYFASDQYIFEAEKNKIFRMIILKRGTPMQHVQQKSSTTLSVSA